MRILKISSLPDNDKWVDKDVIMLHACFQLLQDCVEKEKVCENCNYDTHKSSVDETMFLYNWWMKRKELNEDIDNYEQDDEMLMRLFKIRGFLWT